MTMKHQQAVNKTLGSVCTQTVSKLERLTWNDRKVECCISSMKPKP